MTQQTYTHTVHCFNDKSKRKHFTNITEATAYANKLLADGYKVKIFPYSAPKKYIDFVAERGPNG